MPSNNTEAIARIEGKLDLLIENQRANTERIAKLEKIVIGLDHRDEEHRRNIERFWAQTWPQFETRLGDHESRISALERLQVEEFESRIQAVEIRQAQDEGATRVRMLLWSLMSAIVGAVVAAIALKALG